jgi:hypothetical protein
MPISKCLTIPRALARAFPPVAAAAVLALAGSAVQAQPAGLPEMQSQGSARWVCGGIGSDESAAFRAAMSSHPLSLLFAAPGGAYQADVRVTVRDAAGATALAMRANGPVCLVNLPAGRYVVEAAPDGAAVQSRSAQVGGAPVALDFRF